ncbi:hypothetical protein [Escherichia coli]|uniref:hypothetical protein n=1 Tax=Escherichia coli TaxID=562 RepID=UPI003EB81CAD
MITEKDNVFYCDCGFSFQRNRSGAHDCADGLRNKLAESEARCAALAAENEGMKKFIKADCWVWDDKNEEYIDAVDCMPATPATDAYVSERGE